MSYAASYRRAFTLKGRRVTIERPVPNAAPITAANVRARIHDFAEDEVAGGVNAGQRRVLVLAEDVPATLRPLKQGDKIIVDGLTWRFTSRPDDQTRRDGDVLLAYEGIAAGA